MIVTSIREINPGPAAVVLLILCKKLLSCYIVLQNIVYFCWMVAKLVKIVKPILLIEYENRKRYFSTNPYLRKWLLLKSDRSKYLWRNAFDVI